LPSAALLWRIRGIGRPASSLLRMPLRLWAVRPTRGPLLRPWGDLTSGTADPARDEGERAGGSPAE